MAENFAIFTAPRRDSRHWSAGVVSWEEIIAWADSPANKKECGNYVLGTLKPTTLTHPGEDGECTDFHRRKSAVESRSALTLDVDRADEDFLDTFEMVWGYAALVHTTWNSTPEAPRYRMIIPTDREMAPDEYVLAARAMMQKFGEEHFDASTDEAERYMFKPSAKKADSYSTLVLEGDFVSVDSLLDDFEEDLSAKPMPTPSRNKRDPFEIEGVIGEFNRVYEDWDLLISEYDLPYEKVDENRYHLAGSRSQAGMGPVAGTVGLVYSHHANDPAFGRTCSAFDLVRLHLHGDLDEGVKPGTPVNRLPSQEAMYQTAAADVRVRAVQANIDFDREVEEIFNDDNAWKIDLGAHRAPRSGKLGDVVQAWDLLVDNDPLFRRLRYNELTMSPEVTTPLPWWSPGHTSASLSNADRWEFVDYLEREYRLFAGREKVSAKIDVTAARTPYNPVKDYLESLEWDGRSRVETCLPGVRPTDETRLIARKVMVAAVARMFDPGCKWDHTLVLYGPEGLGKSWWIDRMARGYSSPLGPLEQKDTLLIMQRSWIVVSDEGHSLNRSDHNQQKEFLTRTSDVFRLPYERETLVHPRHCVIWSTTNDEAFLKRQEGNRRFLIVHCEDRVDFDALTDEYVGQVWAEAVALYRAGEPLFLDQEEAVAVAVDREKYVEEDHLFGIVEEYLSQLVPASWPDMSPDQRRTWMRDRDDGFVAPGTHTIHETCSSQIWVEALGRRLGDHKRTDLLEITEVLKRLPGWSRTEGRMRGYGRQVLFTRNREEDLL